MPQETNLNISPYFDDFDSRNGYYKVLFKPGYPVQARELTTSQSILQNQIEKFGTHVFKEGSSVINGTLSYRNDLNAVILENEFQGFSSERFLPYLRDKKIRGERSGVTAVIKYYISSLLSTIQRTTIYVSYLTPDVVTNSKAKFLDGENILIDEDATLSDDIEQSSFLLQAGEGIATTISNNCTTIASAVILQSGTYFLRGHFVDVYDDILYLDQYSNTPSYKVGFRIFEEIVTPYDDPNLNDNAQGFSNYSAPGADRFKIFAHLDKIPIDSINVENFIELLEIRDGRLITIDKSPQYNVLAQEFARRTFDESGDYYIKAPNITVRETLNDEKGNNGIFLNDQLTYNNNIPSEDLGTYSISPIKAYVKGFEVETISPIFLDFSKPRTTKLLENQSINYFTGPTFTLNRVYGSPVIGISTYTVSLRDSRVGESQVTAPGTEIGLARVYDFALESGSYTTSNSDVNQWDISLYDIQTYTEIELNEPISLNIPTHIKGKESGATGYLRYAATEARNITIYNTKGTFSRGERLIFDGIQNTRIITDIKSYGIGDVKSLYGIVGTAYTFTADTTQNTLYNIGQVTITPNFSGISTVTSTNEIFVGAASTGNLVSFSSLGLSVNTFAKIESVNPYELTISGVTTVSGVCDGALPSSTVSPSDFKILTTSLQSSVDNSLYTILSKRNVASVNLSKSQLTIRKQFDISISSNSLTVNTDSSDETFLPFDEERYVLIRKDGTTEPLSSDKFEGGFANGFKTLTISGLGSDDDAKLIATIRKVNIKSKNKIKNKVKKIVVDKSKYSASGVGSTTLNDGLVYGNYPYGTRVQDEELCLLVPDVTKLYGVFESNDTEIPDLPSVTLLGLSGLSNKTGDLLIGEEFVGETSKSIGIYVEKINDLKISFNYLNSNGFIEGERVTFRESGITGTISSLDSGDKNITSSFILEQNQKETIYDVSKLIRKPNTKEPTRKLKIVFESASFADSDLGDITTANSYDQFNYCDIKSINGIRNSDIIDIRPRVSASSVSENTFSPFEFQARTFGTSSNNSGSNVLASDESILLDYEFYLPRIDKILLTKNGVFQLNQGVPSEIPQEPNVSDDAIDLATVTLPAYLCDINQVKVNIKQHKRYRMSDIYRLEERIKNLEYYTSLSLLETDTSNLTVVDSNGLTRFKSGFFVDDFSTTISQKKDTIVKNSIDIPNSELRPTHYTTSIDLLLGTSSLIGAGTTTNPQQDLRTDNNLIGSGIKRTGQLVTLDYEEVAFIQQPYSSRIVNVTPYSSDYFGGTIQLYPSSDIWVDQVRLSPKTVEAEGNYTQTQSQIDADPQTGFGPVIWNAWAVYTGSNRPDWGGVRIEGGRQTIREDLETTTKTGTSTRQGTRQALKEQFDNTSSGDQVLSSQVIPFIRSRNIEFIAKRLKPLTRVYTFFDGIDVSKFATPKLIEINMVSGIFEVGETVIGVSNEVVTDGVPTEFKFRVAKSNHKYGSYDSPSDIYTINPYNKNETIPELYSSTSTILNVDTYSLSNQAQGEFSGYVENGMPLKGQTSGAEAVVREVRLITDSVGALIGSFFIPNGNVDVNPQFECGTKLFRITSSSVNSQIIGAVITSAEEKYYAEGKVQTVQENIIAIRNSRVETQTSSESKEVSETGEPVVINSTVIGTIPPPPPPPPTYSAPPLLLPPKRYEGFASGYAPQTGASGIVNQNVGGTQSQFFTDGKSEIIGAAGVERALADGYSLSSIQDWINRVDAIVDPSADIYGLKEKGPVPSKYRQQFI
jgi:hypothetical protein